MALPDTISGVDFGSQYHVGGPFASGGNYYFVFRDSSTPSRVEVWKSTDPGTSAWSEAAGDALTDVQSIQSLHAVQDGTDIHILVSQVNVSSPFSKYRYYVFSMSSDSFTTTEETVITITTDYPNPPQGVIAVRSDGEIVALIQDATEKVHGTDYSRVSYLKRTSGTWDASTTTVSGTGAQTNFTLPRSVLGASDKVHFTYYDGTDIQHRSLSSADSLSSPEKVNDSSLGSAGSHHLAYLNDGTNDLVICVYYYTPTSKVRSSLITNDGTPAPEVDINTSTANATNFIVASDDTNDKFYALFVDTSSTDLFHDEYDAGWGTDVETWDATTINAIGGANVYDNDATDTVLAYVVNNGGTYQYNEYTLIAAAAGSFPPRLRPLRMLRR